MQGAASVRLWAGTAVARGARLRLSREDRGALAARRPRTRGARLRRAGRASRGGLPAAGRGGQRRRAVPLARSMAVGTVSVARGDLSACIVARIGGRRERVEGEHVATPGQASRGGVASGSGARAAVRLGAAITSNLPVRVGLAHEDRLVTVRAREVQPDQRAIQVDLGDHHAWNIKLHGLQGPFTHERQDVVRYPEVARGSNPGVHVEGGVAVRLDSRRDRASQEVTGPHRGEGKGSCGGIRKAGRSARRSVTRRRGSLRGRRRGTSWLPAPGLHAVLPIEVVVVAVHRLPVVVLVSIKLSALLGWGLQGGGLRRRRVGACADQGPTPRRRPCARGAQRHRERRWPQPSRHGGRGRGCRGRSSRH